MTDDLPPRLTALISGEREAPTGDRRRVRAQLSASLGIGTVASTAAAASAIASKLVVLAIAIGVIGGGAALVVQHRAATATPIAVARRTAPGTASASSAADSAPTQSATEAKAPTLIVRAPIPTQPQSAVPAPARRSSAIAVRAPVTAPPAVHVEPTGDVAMGAAAAVLPLFGAPSPRVSTVQVDQRTLVTLAWSALSRGDSPGALALLDQDANRHPTGALAEERDALRVETLRRLGRASDADRAAGAFMTRFPDSIHRALVAPALAKESP